MKNWKAIIAGVIFTTILVLVSQLAFVLIAAFIGGAKNDFAFLAEHKEVLWRLLALLFFCISMTLGGMATAFLSQINRVRNALIVGALVSLLSLLTIVGKGELTLTSTLLIGLGIAFAAAGGGAWKKWAR
ncbi:MAG: hypothetical protein ABW168_20000 [Sedimenticola sp.]